MAMAPRIGFLAAGLIIGLFAATHFIAWAFYWSPTLGHGLRLSPDFTLYPPWNVFEWRERFGASHRKEFNLAIFMILAGFLLGAMGARLVGESEGVHPNDRKRRRGWGTLADARKAKLLSGKGCVIGAFGDGRFGRLVTTQDLRPTLLTGGTRSGKGRGHVVPTLLNWTGSTLNHDPKGELETISAGWRSTFSYVAILAPRRMDSARINFLAEIDRGPNEYGKVQQIVSILADPAGRDNADPMWDAWGVAITECLVLHVLYTAPDDGKNLLTVKALIADLDATAAEMLRTLHIVNAAGKAVTHPVIDVVMRTYMALHDKFRTSIQGTAGSYFKWIAGEDVERAVSVSDFRLSDLMCADRPMSAYVQVSLADAKVLRPYVRLIFYAASQALGAHEKKDSLGRTKNHNLLLVMDEFPMLGKLDFFTTNLRMLSGYGIKPMFVAQSLNDISSTYGDRNTILDNCEIYTAFACLDPLTMDKVSKLTGLITEMRTSTSQPLHLFGDARPQRTTAPVDRPLMEPGEVLTMPADEQISFVTGYRPFLLKKIDYTKRSPFKHCANRPLPDYPEELRQLGCPVHPWAGVRAAGYDPDVEMPLFKEQHAAISEKVAHTGDEPPPPPPSIDELHASLVASMRGKKNG
jgi:type IV secretion system protein VirD4